MTGKTKPGPKPEPDHAGSSRHEPVAIVGIGCRFPGSIYNPRQFWDLLTAGRDAIGKIPADRWSSDKFYDADKSKPGKLAVLKGAFLDHIDQFDADFFGISPREASYMDPQQRLLLEVTWEALEDAGISPDSLRGSQTGVFVGLFMHDYENLHAQATEHPQMGFHSATGMSTTIAANRISYVFDFHGPSMVIDTACSSSLAAIHLACQSLREGNSELAVAGGVNVILKPEVTMILDKAAMLSPSGSSRAFDELADGYVRGEGAGIIVLKTLSRALADNNQILALIRGTAINQDGRSEGLTVPDASAQAAVMQSAISQAGLTPGDIDYIEAHGTGTPVGDPIEAQALGKVMSPIRVDDNPCLIGSVKTNIGHLEAAAGVAGLIKVVLMMQHRAIPRSLHFETPNPAIDFAGLKLKVTAQAQDWLTPKKKLRYAGINSFGFGGSNAHAVIEEFASEVKKIRPGEQDTGDQDNYFLFPISASSMEALPSVVKNYKDFITESKDETISLQDLSYSLANHKGHLPARTAFITNTRKELLELMESFRSGKEQTSFVKGKIPFQKPPRLIMVFSGIGPQWWSMGRDLLTRETVFRQSMEKCSAEFLKLDKGFNLLEEFTASEKRSRINQTVVAQRAIFALQIALTELWASKGIRPDTVIGHSIGEVAAFHAAGVLSIEDAIRVCFWRSQLQARLAGHGGMLAVDLSPAEAEEILSQNEGVALAAINSPHSVTLAGKKERLGKIAKKLKEDNRFAKLLQVELPYHSPIMEEILPDLAKALRPLKFNPPTIPLVSTVTGDLIEIPPQFDTIEYWCRNVRDPVLFQSAMVSTELRKHDVFLEISPHPVLSGVMLECLSGRGANNLILPSLHREKPATLSLLTSAGNLYCRGFKIDFKGMYPESCQRLKLPAYPWQRERYWNESVKSQQHRLTSQGSSHPLAGSREDNAISTWTQVLDLQSLSYLRDHRVQDNIVFPAAAFVEIGLALAQAQTKEQDQLELADLKISVPMPLAVSERTQVQSNCVNGRFFISSRTKSPQQKWLEHASGTIPQPDQSNQPLEKIDLKALKKLCPDHRGPEEIYSQLLEKGLNYGGSFQGLQKLYLNHNQGLGALRVPDEIMQQDSGYHVHPVILDLALQVFASLPYPGVYLPVEITNLVFRQQPGREFFAFAQLTERKARHIKGNIQIADPEGQVLIEIRGLKCQYAEGARPNLNLTMGDILYEKQWQEIPAASPLQNRSCHYFPSPAQIQAGIDPQLHELSREFRRDLYYRNIVPRLNRLTAIYIWQSLKTMGFPYGPGEPFTPQKLIQILGIIPKYHRLLSQYCRILEKTGLLISSKGKFKLPGPIPDYDLKAEFRRAMLELPEHQAELIMMDRCGLRLPELLSGAEEPLSLIFPPGSEVTNHIYQHSPTLMIYNLYTQLAVRRILEDLPLEQPIRILELGAGTGALTSYLLPLLPKHKTTYVFTDISRAFLNQAESRFSDYSFIEFKHLDLEQTSDPAEFTPHSFDLILAGNVIHATSHIKRSFSHLRSLLSSEGMLLLIEPNQRVCWYDLVFGLLDGWWRFEDSAYRPDHCLLPMEKWEDLLKEEQFSTAATLTDRGPESTHTVLIARGPVLPPVERDSKQTNRQTLSKNGKPMPPAVLIISDHSNDIATQLKQEMAEYDVSPLIYSPPQTESKNGRKRRSPPRLPHEITEALTELGDISSEIPTVIDLRSINLPEGTGSAPHLDYEDLVAGSCQALLSLVQSMGEISWTVFPSLWVITNGSQKTPKDQPLSLGQAPLWGLSRVARSEYPQWQIGLADLSQDPSSSEIRHLCRRILINSPEDELAFRNQRILAHRMIHAGQPFQLMDCPFSLAKTPSKQLSGWHFREMILPEITDREMLVEVKAAGINFKEFARLSGILTVDISPDGMITDLGSECAGVVVKTGAGITAFKVGDAVMGLAKNPYASHVVAQAKYFIRKPDHLSFDAAATIPISYFTAMIAIHWKAQVKPGEKILIHNAAGGFGLAALQLSLKAGAEIYATAGNEEKREFLRRLGISYVGDSHTHDFAAEIMQLTDHQGVDIILNTLPEAGLALSMPVLKPISGRLVDLTNIHLPTQLPFVSLKNGCALYTFDLENLLQSKQVPVEKLWRKLAKDLQLQNFHPLPFRSYSIVDAKGAFELFKRRRHIGKIILNMHWAKNMAIYPRHKSLPVRDDRTYLLAGGLGGLGMAFARHLIDCGARHLMIIGRQGDEKSEVRKKIRDLQKTGVQILVAKADIASTADLNQVMHTIAGEMPPVGGVLHAAMVLDDVLLGKMSEKQLTRVLKPKVSGAWNLHQLTLNHDLDFFLMLSSFAGEIGNKGQGNYAAANAFMDALADFRHSQGLPALALSLGPVARAGYMSKHLSLMANLHRQGIEEISLDQVYLAIRLGMEFNLSYLALGNIEWRQVGRYFPHLPRAPRFHDLTGPAIPTDFSSTSKDQPQSAQQAVKMPDRIIEIISHVLGISKAKLDIDQPLANYGLDSLMSVELNLKLRESFGLDLLAFNLRQATLCVREITELVSGQISKNSTGIPLPDAEEAIDLPASSPGASGLPDDLSDMNVDQLSDEEVDQILHRITRGND